VSSHVGRIAERGVRTGATSTLRVVTTITTAATGDDSDQHKG
jgi:hypothetical protein